MQGTPRTVVKLLVDFPTSNCVILTKACPTVCVEGPPNRKHHPGVSLARLAHIRQYAHHAPLAVKRSERGVLGVAGRLDPPHNPGHNRAMRRRKPQCRRLRDEAGVWDGGVAADARQKWQDSGAHNMERTPKRCAIAACSAVRAA